MEEVMYFKEFDRLIQARKEDKYIGENMFNSYLVKELNKHGAFPKHNVRGYEVSNYKKMSGLMEYKSRKPLTDKQKKMFRLILMKDILPFIDKLITQEKNK